MAAPRTNGVVRLHAKEGIIATLTMTTREVGAAWLAYLHGENSVFDDFCKYTARRPSMRPAWHEWKKTRQRVFDRDGHKCTYCGSTEQLECDHILAVACGGGHEESNLTTACKSCNVRKGSRPVEEFAA